MNTKLAQTEPELVKKEAPVRLSGILLHPTSFPSPYGIGDLGPGAYDFIDFLAASGQHLWQVLPLGPTGFGDSPSRGLLALARTAAHHQPGSAHQNGSADQRRHRFLRNAAVGIPRKVDYGPAIEFKTKLLEKACGCTFPYTG